MTQEHKPSFFERLTGAVRLNDIEEEYDDTDDHAIEHNFKDDTVRSEQNILEEDTYWTTSPENEEEGHLTIDMHETQSEIIIKTLVAGVSPNDLDITITREKVTIRGNRESFDTITVDNYHVQELYWGSFSRTINLPKEIEVEEAEAHEQNGLLTLCLPKINKNRETKIQVKSQ